MVNRYDKPAQAQFINAYAPVDFDALYRIGAANKAAVDQAEKELEANIKTFGSFRSLSEKDTQNYYNESIGKLKDLIQTAAENPDAMKSASFRSQLQSRINNIDYAKLSMYMQNAENFNKRAENIAKMKAEGLYNLDWDNINMAAWDTDKQGIMNELAPIRYLTANQLSNAYFDNMKPGTLKPVWQKGIKYNVTGNTYDDLLAIAKAHENDLINTPQGQMYMKQFRQQAGGDETKAREMFTDMIAQSQIDRILRPKLEVDPVELLRMKDEYDGSKNTVTALPNRQQKMSSDILSNIQNSAYKRDSKAYDKAVSDYSRTSENILPRLDSLSVQYASNRNDTTTYRMLREAQYELQEARNNLYDSLIINTTRKAFKDITKVDVSKGNTIDKKDYNRGVRAALSSISSTSAIHPDDPILSTIGGVYHRYTSSSGNITGEYSYPDSKGFLMPETVFQLASDSKPVDNKRRTGILRSDQDFLLRQLIEDGKLTDVRFKPDGTNNMLQLGNNKLISGKLLISKEDLEKQFGTSFLDPTNPWINIASISGSYLFGRQPLSKTVEELFDGKNVSYGEDGKEFYSIDIYKTLPSNDDIDYWTVINQLEFNSTSTPSGIGSSKEAAAQYPFTIQSLMNNN